jgi:hypothetical protein
MARKLLLLAMLLAGCKAGVCARHSDCGPGEVCSRAGLCEPGGPVSPDDPATSDGGAAEPDASVDAGVDGGN